MTNHDHRHEYFASWDGAYVLGALSAAERAAFEEHLSGCWECAESVRELGHLPGLLSTLPAAAADTAAMAAPQEEPPPTVLPGVIQRIARERRRRRWRTAATALAAAAVAATVTVAIVGTGPADETPRPTTAMSAVAPAPIHAVVGLRALRAGTEVTVMCSYDGTSGYPAESSYALVVTGRDGQIQQIGAWRITPAAPVAATSVTSLDRAQIKSIEITTSSGRPVLRLTM